MHDRYALILQECGRNDKLSTFTVWLTLRWCRTAIAASYFGSGHRAGKLDHVLLLPMMSGVSMDGRGQPSAAEHMPLAWACAGQCPAAQQPSPACSMLAKQLVDGLEVPFAF